MSVTSLISVWATGCHRLHNRIDRIDLVCGTDQTSRVFQVLDHGTPVPPSDVEKLELKNVSLMDRYTAKGCFYLEDHEQGTLVMKRKSGTIGYIAAEVPQSSESITSLNLETFENLTIQPALQAQVYEEFCPIKSRTVYSRDPLRLFHLNFTSFGRLPGLKITAQVLDQAGSQASFTLLDRAFTLTPVEGSLPMTLNFATGSQQPAAFEVRLQVSDLFGQTFETPACTFVVSASSPRLLEVAGSSYSSGQYIEVEKRRHIELKVESPVPLRTITLKYQGHGEELVEQYVPFKVGPDQWSAIAPLPKLSGSRVIRIGIESEATAFSEEQVAVDFGENIYYGSPAKLLIPSNNGNFLLVLVRDTLTVFDTHSNQKVFDFTHAGDILNAQISTDGRHLLLAVYADESVIIDRETGKRMNLRGSLKTPQFLNQGQELFALEQDRNLVWFDVKTGMSLKRLQVNGDIIRHAVIDVKESQLVVSTDRRKFYRIDLATRKDPEFLSECPTGSDDRLAISPRGDKIAYNCSEVAYVTSLDSSSPAIEVFRFKPGDGIRALSFSPQGDQLAIGGGLGEWTLYQMENRSFFPNDQVFALRNRLYFNAPVVDMMYSPDGRFIMMGSDDGQTMILSTSSWQVVDRRLLDGIMLRGFVTSKMSYYLASQKEDLHFYRLPSPTQEFKAGLPVNSLTVSQQGLMTVSTLSSQNSELATEAKALVFDLKDGSLIRTVIHGRTINSAEISPDGQGLLTASEDGKAKISDIHADYALDLSVLFDDTPRPVRKAFYSHSGNRAGVVIHDQIFVVDAKTGTALQTLKADDWYPSAEFSKDDSYIVTAGSDQTARIYKAETGKLLAVSQSAGWVWNAKLSPDGHYLASLSWDNKLRIKETVRSGEDEIQGLRDFIELDLSIAGEYLSFSPDSKYLVFSLWGGDSFFLDLSSRTLRKLPCVQKGFSSTPAFSGDSQLMAVGHNSTAYLYKIPELKPIQTIAHADRVTSLGFLDDRFFSGSWDGSVKSTKIDLTPKATCAFGSQ